VENVYINLQQIYSGNGMSNFIRIARVLWKILFLKTSRSLFWTHCAMTSHKPELFNSEVLMMLFYLCFYLHLLTTEM